MSELDAKNEFSAVEWKGMALKSDEVRSKTFDSCVFIKCAFQETVFSGCRFRGCVFKGCDLSLAKLSGCQFSETRFEDSRLIGINWAETAWEKGVFLKPADFKNCTLNHSSFLGLNLRKVELVQCVARNVDFAEADLTQSVCRGTDFHESRFLHTNLTGADFRGARNYAIAPALNTLKKTRFSLPEAMALLYGLDIILEDDET